jgi:hypothetical protein
LLHKTLFFCSLALAVIAILLCRAWRRRNRQAGRITLLDEEQSAAPMGYPDWKQSNDITDPFSTVYPQPPLYPPHLEDMGRPFAPLPPSVVLGSMIGSSPSIRRHSETPVAHRSSEIPNSAYSVFSRRISAPMLGPNAHAEGHVWRVENTHTRRSWQRRQWTITKS